MADAPNILTTHRQYEHDVISDSSTELPYTNRRAKRPWSNESHDSIDEQDTIMSGDDSLSSGCSISEMRSLKRLRIQDSQPQRPSFQTWEMQNCTDNSSSVLRSVSISSNVSVASKFAPTKETTRSSHYLPVENTPSLLSSKHSHGRKYDEASTPHVAPVEEGTTGFGCNNHQNTGEMHKSNEEYRGNHLLGNLHMNRRHHQRPTKNAPNWKRQVRLQSNSQLY